MSLDPTQATIEEIEELYTLPYAIYTAHLAAYAAVVIHGADRGGGVQYLLFDQVRLFIDRDDTPTYEVHVCHNKQTGKMIVKKVRYINYFYFLINCNRNV